MSDGRSPDLPSVKIIRPGHRMGPKPDGPKISWTSCSSLGAFLICPQYHGFGYEMGLRPVEDKEALILGSLIHVGLAYHYGMRMNPRPAWMVYPSPEAPDPRAALWTCGHDNLDIAEKALRIFDAYTAFYNVPTLRPVLIEHQFDSILNIDGVPEKYTLRIDLLAEDTAANNELVLLDHKSIYKFTKWVGMDYRTDREMLTGLALSRAAGYDVKRVVINGIQKGTKERPEPRFERFDVPVSEDAYNRLGPDVAHAIRTMRYTKQVYPDPTNRPRVFESCVRKYGRCLHPDTAVYSAPSGAPVKIKDLRVGDLVWNAKGHQTAITGVARRNHKGRLVGIRAMGVADELLTTPEHEIQTMRRAVDDSTRRLEVMPKARWTHAGDVLGVAGRWSQPHDVLLLPPPRGNVPALVFDLIQAPTKRCVIPPRRVHGSARLARLLGYFAAEGCTKNGRSNSNGLSGAIFAFHRKETRLHEEVIGDAKKLFNRVARLRRVRHTKGATVTIHDTVVAAFLREQCGSGAQNKRMPAWIVSARNLNIVRAAVRSLWLGDGHNSKKRGCRFVSTSVVLTHQMRLMLLRLGIASVYHRVGAKPGHRVAYTLDVDGVDSARKLRALVGFAPLGYVRGERLGHRSKLLRSGQLTAPVKTVRTRKYVGDVYDIEVASGSSFVTTSGVVHNCQFYPVCADGPNNLVQFTRKW